MNKFKWVFGFVFLFFIGTVLGQQQLPNLVVKTLDGKSGDIKDYLKDGKITVISFWATWCAPCKKELDAIAEIYEDWQEDYQVDLLAITIDTQRQLAKVGPLVESKGWTYHILAATSENARQAFNFQAIPQTFLVDNKGEIVYTHNGYVPGDELELEDKIKALIGK